MGWIAKCRNHVVTAHTDMEMLLHEDEEEEEEESSQFGEIVHVLDDKYRVCTRYDGDNDGGVVIVRMLHSRRLGPVAGRRHVIRSQTRFVAKMHDGFTG